jgi:SAM-dependent methyltransferase
MPLPNKPQTQPPGSSARLYDAYQDGKDAYESDRETAARIAGLGLDPKLIATQNRAFHNRATHHAARDLGIHQILDVGCGMPAKTGPNTHQILEEIHPDTYRVLYVDHDPIVRAHAQALMRGSRRGSTSVVEADLRTPDLVLDAAREHLDLAHPVCLLLVAVVHFLGDDDQPHDLVRTLTDALPPGSALVLSHVTDDFAPDVMRQAEALLADVAVPARTRPYDDIHRFFDGLTLTDPGLVPVHQWHQDDPDIANIPTEEIHNYGGIGVKQIGTGPA